MPWTDIDQTKVDVITILGLPADAPRWVELVQRKLERLPIISGEPIIATVEGWITTWKAAETALDAGADQGGLIQADVLRWEPGGRNAGHQNLMDRYALRILRTLFTPDERREIEQEMGRSKRVRIAR
jgi:hypothetical protein